MSEAQITVGNVSILALSDARVDYPWPIAELFPAAAAGAWDQYRARYPSVFGDPDHWRSDFGCYLVRSEGRTILVDTGIGPAGSPMAAAFGSAGCLVDKLRSHGANPEDIDAVVLTHLHPDHTGWTLQDREDGRALTFARARYIMPEVDWRAFHTPEVQAHFPFAFVAETITPVESLGALDLARGETAVTGELTLIPTPGHTPGHMSILVSSAGQKAIILGDVAVHPAQITEVEWNVMFEMDGGTAVTTRRQVLDRIEAEGMTVAACHFPEPGFGHLVRIEGKRYWQSIELPGA